MRLDTLARRYAHGLLLAVDDTEKLDEVGDQLEAVAGALASAPGLMRTLTGPLLDHERARGLWQQLGKELDLSPLVVRFYELLFTSGRLGLLERIVHHYRLLADEAQGRVTARVRSAGPLTPEQQQALSRRLGALFGKQVVLDISVEPALLGGVEARVGSIVLDGTLRNELSKLQSFIRERPAG